MNISGISGNDARRFTTEEEDALAKSESTSALLNRARSSAGQRGGEVAVRGDDGTLDERMRDYKTHVGVGKSVSGTAEAIELATILGSTKLALAGVVTAPAALIGVHFAMKEMQDEKDGRRDAATRDVMHVALVSTLDVPDGFRQKEMARYGVSFNAQSPAKKIADQIASDPGARATLQLHSDQGMNAARDMIDAGVATDAFLTSNPKIAQRYASDAAFKNGFDALVWAKSASPATYAETVARLESRDARYSASSVTYRL